LESALHFHLLWVNHELTLLLYIEGCE
jgi:hypothetical protein